MALSGLNAEFDDANKITSAIRAAAMRLGVKLSEEDLERMAEFSASEWRGPPPSMESMRDLISAYLHYVGRVEEAKRVQRSDACRGRMLKRLKGYFEPESAPRGARRPVKMSGDEVEAARIPYEELRCPRCRGTIVVGDLAAIDHYLRHFNELEIGGRVVRELADYRGLPDEDKLTAYRLARKHFERK